MEKNEAGLDIINFLPAQKKHSKMVVQILSSKSMICYDEYVTKKGAGNELDEKKLPGRTGARRTGSLSLRACYFEMCGKP